MDIDVYSRFLLALVFILALIGGLAWLARRFGLGGKLVTSQGANRRLSIVEVMTLDSRRKLVLLRRDSSEHLVLLGPTSDLLIDSDTAKLPATGAEDAQQSGEGHAAKEVP